jgi:uncharacterized LabA/DUF88 family protein
MRSTNEIVYAFIDSQNLNLGVRSLGWELDFKKFRVYLNDKYNVKEAYLFIGFIESNQKLYKHLESSGYKLIFKPVIVDNYRKVKGNVDAELVMYTMLEIENFDKAIIVSGDGDFYCLIEYLFEHNKLGKVLTPNDKYSSLLRALGKEIISLSKLKDKIGKS